MAKVHTNGSGKRMPVLTTDIALDGDYEGYVVTVRTNPRFGTKLDMSSGDDERFMRAVREIVLSWNICDEDGNALPAPHESADAIMQVPDELLTQLLNKYVNRSAEATELPKD